MKWDSAIFYDHAAMLRIKKHWPKKLRKCFEVSGINAITMKT